ncbi:MAG: lytic transglycosylase domain-containing protein [Proteobacteria bacterium]|uniref:lytic transglycosylase domain-containing protein n=1 Tax=Aquabacterium sp. TaxID=1872578 RepID=UPI0035C6FD79|nr:lytic transglycosylase domain-containing protein [Pseudomonadota bacterium]
MKVKTLRDTCKYASRRARRWTGGLIAAAALACLPAQAQSLAGLADDRAVSDAREALRVRDKARLLADRDALIAAQHPLAPWVDYWYFQLRLVEIGPSEVDEFLARWPDSYVADRARNDWLLELGRRQNWPVFLRIQPGFRMNDDREVSCLGVLARFQTRTPMEGPGDWREQARQAWWNQKDADHGCDAMAKALLDGGVLNANDVWRKLRLAIEADKPRAVQQSARLLGDTVVQAVNRLMSQPQAFLMPSVPGAQVPSGDNGVHAPGANIGPDSPRGKARPGKASRHKAEAKAGKKARPKPTLAPIPVGLPPELEGPLNLLALVRWAGIDPAAAASALDDAGARERWHWRAEEAAWAWSQVGRAAAWRLQPEAPAYFERALADRAVAASTGEWRGDASRLAAAWSPETLAWMVRAGLRSATAGTSARWGLVEAGIEAMAPEQQQDGAWQYWKAQALLARARPMSAAAQAHDPLRQQAHELLGRVANPLTFYGQLAAEALHRSPAREPVRPAPLTEAELAQARALPGVDRALRMLALGWRSEAVREWNFTLSWGKPGGLSDRELLAVAEEACRREIWDRCINSSERTRQEIDLQQRYPTPYKDDVLAAAREVGLDAAYMYGLIRQESRFIVAAKSSVGAAGLMQVMPATAAWTARKLGIDFKPEQITDRQTNLRIGAGYLKLVLDDFQGAQALAAAAYNAGPSRPRRWREGSRLDAAAWVENIPFNETRDYVKKVLSNATVYAHLLQGRSLSVKARLGATVGPRASSAPPPEGDLP